MNKKTEDQLVRLAFGDLTPEEATRLQAEAESHPDSARALETYRRMKSELRSLADVPEDQLSKERLREAILTRGLREQAPKRTFTWLWMPAAAAALAFGITFGKAHFAQPNAPMVASVIDDSVVKDPGSLGKGNMFSVKPHRPILDSVPPAGTFEEEPTNETSTPTDGLRYASNMSRSHRGRDGSRLESTLREIANSMTVSNAATPGPSTIPVTSGGPGGTGGQPPETLRDPKSTAPTPVLDSPKQPIILIQPEKDSSTGARKATEVESASNVLVGG